MARTTRTHEYDVCLSFAGEQRPYVQAVADALIAAGIRCFYDNYEKASLWGKDLYVHLDYIYREAAQYCVIFSSVDYARKLWTSHERKSAQARAFSENSEYILPARFDDTSIPGVQPTTGHIDLRTTSPDEVAGLIIQKIQGTAGPLHPRQIRSKQSTPRSPTFKSWSFRTGGSIWAQPVISGDIVYIGSSDCVIYALDISTGQLRWSRELPFYISSSPAASTDAVYLGLPSIGWKGGVVGLSALNGQPCWEYGAGTAADFAPTVIDNIIYFAGGDGKVRAITAGKTRPRWASRVGAGNWYAPQAADGMIYIGGTSGHICALESRTGKERWRYTTKGKVEAPLAVGNGTVIATSRSDGVYAVTAAAGKFKWSIKSRKRYSSATIAGDFCYIGNDQGYIQSLSLDKGQERWSYPVHGGVGGFGSPVVSDGVVYVGTLEGYLYALDADEGTWIWSRKVKDCIPAAVSVAHGMVYFCSSDSAYAVDALTGKGGLRRAK
ncbi:PQQ-binding-like beta-propeller repeat protein [Kitasatospora herbaricolor]|uniref:outer membrane protein assembly factor BamB family protein n=1 Tax=Kitasatospora herbaricolor TaxID=68217 RepID=UPI0036DD876C